MALRIILYILAAASFGYGYTLYRVHSGSNFFLVWGFIGILLIALGLALKFELFKKLPLWLNIGTAVLAGAFLIFISCILIRIVSYSENRPEPRLDYIIVLGAQVLPDNTPSKVLKYRLEAAEAYLKNNPGTLCIVSGGKGTNEMLSEAEAMKKYLTDSGIEADRIIKEDRSTNTDENIRFSQKLLPEGASVGIVTSNFHLYRSIYLCKREGLEKASPIAAESEAFYAPNNYFREAFAFIKDWLFD